MPHFDMEFSNPKFTRPELLRHGQIPAPLASVAPRTIEGQEWWDVVRKQAYQANNYCCWACGEKEEGPLEAHEAYDIDYERGTSTFIEVVALCSRCHQFIHIGRAAKMLSMREMTKTWFKKVYMHGRKALKTAGLKIHWGHKVVLQAALVAGLFSADVEWVYAVIFNETDPVPTFDWRVEWANWRMVYKGKKYPPAFKDESEMRMHYETEEQ